MELNVPDIREIFEEILSEKIIKKNKAYGNSIYDVERILGTNADLEELIKVRIDDKLKRMKLLDPESEKYDSEIMEIIAYMLHLLNYRRREKEKQPEENPSDKLLRIIKELPKPKEEEMVIVTGPKPIVRKRLTDEVLRNPFDCDCGDCGE